MLRTHQQPIEKARKKSLTANLEEINLYAKKIFIMRTFLKNENFGPKKTKKVPKSMVSISHY